MDLSLILNKVKTGEISVSQASKMLGRLPYEDIGFAKLDHHRKVRTGFGEVIFSPGKTVEQLLKSCEHFYSSNSNILATRVSEVQADAVLSKFKDARFDRMSRTLSITVHETSRIGRVAVCSAGTGDMPVAEETAVVAEFFGANVDRHYDIGVAGIHRLFSKLDDIKQANAVAAIAGMEGALGSVIAGLVEVPVVAVPTSIGYGTSFGGLSALLTMLNSCAEGLSVVNIDNGFGGGYLLAQINRLVEGKRTV